jgi:aminoglycoside phosphotransferase
MINEELQIVSNLTSVAPENIKYSDNGFLSRGYIIDNGRIVFKFKKQPDVSYKNEIKMLNFVNSLNLNINLQKVGWTSEDDSYLGIYGVIGRSLESIELTDDDRKNYGKQIGLFLQKMHSVKYEDAEKLNVNEEIKAWQKRFEKSKDLLSCYFKDEEIEKMNNFVYLTAPARLSSLGENMVFSHGDLGMGNIFVDDNDKIGIIDFSESVYLDEAADFMDIEDDRLCQEVLNAYNADNILREKVAIRRTFRPMFVIGTYRDRPENEIMRFVNKIREWLNRNN